MGVEIDRERFKEITDAIGMTGNGGLMWRVYKMKRKISELEGDIINIKEEIKEMKNGKG